MIDKVMSFLADESGATAIEYATIAALATVGVVGGIDLMGQGVDGGVPAVSSGLETAAAEPGVFDCGVVCDKAN